MKEIKETADEEKSGVKTHLRASSYNEDGDPEDWGWFVLLGSSLCFMLVGMQGPCFGIFYGDRLQELGSSSSLAAWIFNCQAFWYNFAGPLAAPLSRKFGHRLVALVSGTIANSSFIISAYVTNPFYLLFTFSFICGTGGGVCINCCFQMNTKYFRHRLGLANGIMMAGGSLGLVLVPQLASYLQQIYPFEWANIIAGIIMMNAIPATMLFHPVEWHLRKTKSSHNTTDEAIQRTVSKESSVMEIKQSSVPTRPIYNNNPRMYLGPKMKYQKGIPRGFSVPHDLLNHNPNLQQHNRLSFLNSTRRIRTLSESPSLIERNGNESSKNLDETESQRGSKLALFYLGGSTIIGSVLTLQQLPTEHVIMEGSDEGPGFSKKIFRHQQPSVFKDPLIISVALFTSVTIPTAMNIFGTVPFVMTDAGYNVQSAASAVTVNAIADFCTRLVCALIVDQPWAYPRMIYGFGQIIMIIVPLGLINGWQYHWAIFLCMGAIGVGLGVIYALDVFLIAYLTGAENLVKVFSISQLIRAFGFIIFGPIGGVLRDVTGDYVSAFLFFIGVMAVAFMIMLFTIFLTHRQSKPEDQNLNDNNSDK